MMMSPKATTAFLLLLLSSYNPISGFSATNKNKKNAPQTSNVSDLQMKRSTFVQQIMTSASLLVLSPSSPAFAKEIDPAVKGTKKDPKYESCVSSCMFECTKPKVRIIHYNLFD